MSMRKFKNDIQAVYRHNGQQIDVPDSMRCPDCRTPVVWVEDDMTVSRIYHDPTCIQVRTGRGEVAPLMRRRKPVVWPTELDIANARRED